MAIGRSSRLEWQRSTSLFRFLLLCTVPILVPAFVPSLTQQQPYLPHTRHSMFTGIVEEMGTVVRLEESDSIELWDGSIGKGTILQVQCQTALQDAYLGCSICVSGVCLTATHLSESTFTVGLAPETLQRTYFPSLTPGDAVNLERASDMGGRNSGHFVQGHVDGTGTIVSKIPNQDSLVFKIQVDDPSLMQFIVPKGFIAIDGTSLTVIDVGDDWFSFMLIEYTQKKIIIPQKDVSEKVNLEVDVLAKYSASTLQSVVPRLQALEDKVARLEAELAIALSGDS